jgi:hypothetical protein
MNERLCEQTLREIEQIYPSGSAERALLRNVLAAFCAIPDSVSFGTLLKLLACDEDMLRDILDQLKDYFPAQPNREFALADARLKAYIRTHPHYEHRVHEMDRRVRHIYTEPYDQQHNPAEVDLCILRHLPFYLATTPDFIAFLTNYRWLQQLRLRSRSYTICQEALRRAAEAATSAPDIEQRILHVTLCAIVSTSMAARLPPEVVVYLAHGCQMWTQEQATDYAAYYATRQDQEALCEALADMGRAAAMIATLDSTTRNTLDGIARLAEPDQEPPMRAWMATQEPDVQDQREMLIEALHDSSRPIPSTYGLHAQTTMDHWLARLRHHVQQINENETFSASATQTLTLVAQHGSAQRDQLPADFLDLLHQIAEQWRPNHRTVAASEYHDILHTLTPLSRSNLFEALVYLVPAIQRNLSPELAGQLAEAIESVTTLYP